MPGRPLTSLPTFCSPIGFLSDRAISDKFRVEMDARAAYAIKRLAGVIARDESTKSSQFKMAQVHELSDGPLKKLCALGKLESDLQYARKNDSADKEIVIRQEIEKRFREKGSQPSYATVKTILSKLEIDEFSYPLDERTWDEVTIEPIVSWTREKRRENGESIEGEFLAPDFECVGKLVKVLDFNGMILPPYAEACWPPKETLEFLVSEPNCEEMIEPEGRFLQLALAAEDVRFTRWFTSAFPIRIAAIADQAATEQSPVFENAKQIFKLWRLLIDWHKDKGMRSLFASIFAPGSSRHNTKDQIIINLLEICGLSEENIRKSNCILELAMLSHQVVQECVLELIAFDIEGTSSLA